MNTLLNAQTAKASTMLKALHLVRKYNLINVAIETDNLYVDTLLLEVSIEPSWQIHDLIVECRGILNNHTSTTVIFT